jgi:CSLREA domain-containing protein
MKITKLSLFATALLLLSVLAVINVRAQTGRLFTVNDAADTNDANAGDGFCADANGKCTLRAAVQEANAAPAQDAVNFSLPTPSTINLTLGELPITSNIYIVGPGARKLTVQRSPSAGTANFRIFNINYSETPPFPITIRVPITIRGLTLKNGNTASDGGAVFINYNTLVQLTEVAIINNTAASGGGIFSAGILNLTRSLVSSNTGTGQFGGGIANFNPQGFSIISNSTIINNSGGQGGAIYNSEDLLLINNTITQNFAGTSGSSVTNASGGTVNVLNTIIGMDTSSAVTALSGAFNSLGNNIITDARNSTGFSNGVNGDQVSDNNAINPLLGALADNGGQTDTRALLDGSPAINHGNNCVYNGTCAQPIPQRFNLSTDQRGSNLRQGGEAVDVGAYEIQTLIISGSGGLAAFGFRNRAGGILLVLTRASTNEKQYRVTSPFGNFFFDNLNFWDVYFLERKGKRLGSSGLLIFDFDTLPTLQPSLTDFEKEGIKIVLDKKAVAKSK